MRLPEVGDTLISNWDGPLIVTNLARHRGWLLIQLGDDAHPGEHLLCPLHPEMTEEAATRFSITEPTPLTDKEGIVWWGVGGPMPSGFYRAGWEKQVNQVSQVLDEREEELRQAEVEDYER